uniref:AP2/ERF domain-containing protein n=1 Tax=Quercus lobata TaxID=97700 RepID=A0A7N2R1X5_QUELO
MEVNTAVKSAKKYAPAITCSIEGDQQQKQPQADQATTVGSVKKSSRFRGVSSRKWKLNICTYDTNTDGLDVLKLIYGIKGLGIQHRGRRESKVTDYEKEIAIINTVTKEEYLASLRRRSSGFSGGVSKYRGVARWEARIGRVFGNKYLYLGTYSSEEEAAHAYDNAAIEYRDINALTNFDLSTYIKWLRPGAKSVASQEPKSSVESNPITNK